MASRDDEDREHRAPSRWEADAPRASQVAGAEPWRRDAAHVRQEAGPRGFAGEGSHGAAAAGTVYGSGRWSSLGSQSPSGYSGPSGTGYGQSCPGQSGYGQAEGAHGSGVSYAATSGYAGYAGARHHPPAPMEYAPDPMRPDGDDIDYQQWRDEQLRKLDSDYLSWRQARYRKFADEFNAWRLSRHDTAGAAPATTPAAGGGTGRAAATPDADGSTPPGEPSLPSSSQPT